MPFATLTSSVDRASGLPAGRTIVAGCDGHGEGRAEISLAATIATATGACLSVVSPASEKSVRAICGRLAPEADVEMVPGHAPARSLRRVAAAKEADVLVIRRRWTPTSAGEDGDSLRSLHGAPCAVAVAPAAYGATRLSRIGVGVDATRESRLAFAMALELAGGCGAALELFAVVDDAMPSWLLRSPHADDVAEEIVTRRLNGALEVLGELTARAQDVRVTAKVLVGRPSEQLLRASGKLDMLVVGSRRAGPSGRLGLGATSDRLLREARCPVLVVPSGASRPIARNR
jgi:nucleotide-binding universal stress UspA family protein